jgi:hypothetical protein
MKGTYFRWTRKRATETQTETLDADILGSDIRITAVPSTGLIVVTVPDRPIDADEARLIGVRLIEAAALADDSRSVREP